MDVKEFPITWVVQRLMCKCGGEFQHRFTIKTGGNIQTPHTHVCNKCSALEQTSVAYPVTVWREA